MLWINPGQRSLYGTRILPTPAVHVGSPVFVVFSSDVSAISIYVGLLRGMFDICHVAMNECGWGGRWRRLQVHEKDGMDYYTSRRTDVG